MFCRGHLIQGNDSYKPHKIYYPAYCWQSRQTIPVRQAELKQKIEKGYVKYLKKMTQKRN
jgi:hypothetical protein